MCVRDFKKNCLESIFIVKLFFLLWKKGQRLTVFSTEDSFHQTEETVDLHYYRFPLAGISTLKYIIDEREILHHDQLQSVKLTGHTIIIVYLRGKYWGMEQCQPIGRHIVIDSIAPQISGVLVQTTPHCSHVVLQMRAEIKRKT